MMSRPALFFDASTVGAVPLAICIILAANAPSPAADVAPAHPDTTGWRQLFAPDLSDAIAPAGIWSWHDGILGATEDQCLWTREEYADFTLDLEFRNSEGTNSGVFVYGSDLKDSIPNSIEIQIADDHFPKRTNGPASWRCGAFFGHKPPTRSVVRRPGEWNRMTITCRGPTISVVLNGEPINEIDLRQWTSAKKNPDGTEIPPWLSKPWAQLPTRGHIGLQGKHAGAPIEFRNIRISALSPR